jgi:hypothetical protein
MLSVAILIVIKSVVILGAAIINMLNVVMLSVMALYRGLVS